MFVFIFDFKAFFSFCAIVYILTKDHFRVQKWSIFRPKLWVVSCALQQQQLQKQAEAPDQALFSEYHYEATVFGYDVNRPEKVPTAILYSCR